MKSFLETLIIAAAIAFIGWLINEAGMKFGIKIKGKESGFTIGGPSKEESAALQLQMAYRSGRDTVSVILARDMIDKFHDTEQFKDFLKKGWPYIGDFKVEVPLGDTLNDSHSFRYVCLNLYKRKSFPSFPNGYLNELTFERVFETYTVVKPS